MIVGPKTLAIFDAGILTSLAFATRRKCCIKKASVSRLAIGRLFTAQYKSFIGSVTLVLCAALVKSFHDEVGINGSRKLRKKSLIQPQRTCTSILDRAGIALPRIKRS